MVATSPLSLCPLLPDLISRAASHAPHASAQKTSKKNCPSSRGIPKEGGILAAPGKYLSLIRACSRAPLRRSKEERGEEGEEGEEREGERSGTRLLRSPRSRQIFSPASQRSHRTARALHDSLQREGGA